MIHRRADDGTITVPKTASESGRLALLVTVGVIQWEVNPTKIDKVSISATTRCRLKRVSNSNTGCGVPSPASTDPDYERPIPPGHTLTVATRN